MLELTGTPRFAVSVLISTTSTLLVGTIIGSIIPPTVSLNDKIVAKVGGYGLGLTAGAIASKYVLENIDDTLDALNKIIAHAKAQSV